MKDHARRMHRDLASRTTITPRGMLHFALHDTENKIAVIPNASEESPVRDHACMMQRARRRRATITPWGMLRFALHDSVADGVLRRVHHPSIGHSERSEESPVRDHDRWVH